MCFCILDFVFGFGIMVPLGDSIRWYINSFILVSSICILVFFLYNLYQIFYIIIYHYSLLFLCSIFNDSLWGVRLAAWLPPPSSSPSTRASRGSWWTVRATRAASCSSTPTSASSISWLPPPPPLCISIPFQLVRKCQRFLPCRKPIASNMSDHSIFFNSHH